MVTVDPIALELARNQLASVAEEMGVVLRRTASGMLLKRLARRAGRRTL